MDAVLVVKDTGLEVVEARRLRRGDMVVVGRTESEAREDFRLKTEDDPPTHAERTLNLARTLDLDDLRMLVREKENTR